MGARRAATLYDSIDSESPTLIQDDIEVAQADPHDLINLHPAMTPRKFPTISALQRLNYRLAAHHWLRWHRGAINLT